MPNNKDVVINELNQEQINNLSKIINSTYDEERLLAIAASIAVSDDIRPTVKHKYHKKIASKLKSTLAILEEDYKAVIKNSYNGEYEDRSASNQLEVIDRIIKKIGEDNLIFTKSSFYLFDPDKPYHWQKKDDRFIKAFIQSEINSQEVTKSKIDSILGIVNLI